MAQSKIQQVFDFGWEGFSSSCHPSPVQKKAALSLMRCKSGALGCNAGICLDCGHTEIHNNSCRSRNCPNCQAVQKEIWVDNRRVEVIDAPYFHVVSTLPHELNPLLYSSQQLLYGFFHRCCAETLLELSKDKKHLGAVPGIIQILHTWNQELNYHVHMHCIVSGGGLLNPYEWAGFLDSLYKKDWCPYIKETFNGFGNAIEYPGRYTHKTAISNSRINNRYKSRNLKLIFTIQGHQRFRARYTGLTAEQLLKMIWNVDVSICPVCGCGRMQNAGRTRSSPMR